MGFGDDRFESDISEHGAFESNEVRMEVSGVVNFRVIDSRARG